MHIEPGADLVIIGDSHSAALQMAASARGLSAKMLYLSGNFWHENKMMHDRVRGISATYRRGLQRQIEAFADDLGGTVFPANVPILASFGYHLGRLVPLLTRHHHSLLPLSDQIYLSDSFINAYLLYHRGGLYRLLRLAARRADVIVVAPPLVQADPIAREVARRITTTLQGYGLRVFDPDREPDWAGAPLPVELRSADQVHGNAAYGEEVLSRLEARGLLKLQPQPSASVFRVRPGTQSTSPSPFSLATRLATNSQSDNRLR